jgi:hypothetical protein
MNLDEAHQEASRVTELLSRFPFWRQTIDGHFDGVQQVAAFSFGSADFQGAANKAMARTGYVLDWPVSHSQRASQFVIIHNTLRTSQTTATITMMVPSNPKPSISFLL